MKATLPERILRAISSACLVQEPHLTVFSICQFLIYFDRGIMAGLLTYIAKEFKIGDSDNLSALQAGLLGGSFMLGYMIASPLFARLGQHNKAWSAWSIIIGLALWATSAVCTYFVYSSYTALMIFRLVAGAGEAAFLFVGSSNH